LLKSRNEPFEGGGSFFGAVASQIIFDRLRSIGNMVIANKNRARNAMAKMRSIPAETRIASIIMGIHAPVYKGNSNSLMEVYTMGVKLKVIHCTETRLDDNAKKNSTYFLEFEVLSKC